ncbi:hypothetical protein MSPP1_003587 [Malassezia sp. CBS 17886]|nr:hypothetical protein MSPP1_003587 [Malassezia sp. CBS 17886]
MSDPAECDGRGEEKGAGEEVPEEISTTGSADAEAPGGVGTSGSANGPQDNLRAIPLSTRLEEATTLKALGNDQFGKKMYSAALNHYMDAVARLPARVADDGGEDESGIRSVTLDEHLLFDSVLQLRVKLYANLAACHLKLDQYDETIRACTEVLAEEDTNVKALHRRAVAYEKLGGWANLSNARKDCDRLHELDEEGYVPSAFRPELAAARQRLPSLIEAAAEGEKNELVGKLRNLGDKVLGFFGMSTNNFQFEQQDGGGYSLNFKQDDSAK